jgi:hypothetical protein
VSLGGQILTWSLTWKDVVSPEIPAVPRWTGESTLTTQLRALISRMEKGASGSGDKLENALLMVDGDPVRGLVAYLAAPTRLDVVSRLTAFLLLQTGRRQPKPRVADALALWRSAEQAPDLSLDESEGDIVVCQRQLGEYARLLVDAPADRLGMIMAEPEAVTLTLRLEDDETARVAPGFEQSWRLWLRAWNVLQALPRAALVTRAAVASDGEATVGGLGDSHGAPARGAPHGAQVDARLTAASEIVDADAARIVREVLARYPDLPAPSVPLELRRPVDAVDGDVEAGWRDRRVAAYLDSQAEIADRLRADGWTLLSIDRKLDVSSLEQALGLTRKAGGDGTARDQ